MIPNPDFIAKRYGPMRSRSLKIALAHRLRKEFPRLGGDRILNLCADMILETLGKHLRPLEDVAHGQVVWLAVSKNDPPARGKKITHTDLVPVILNLSTHEDIDALLDRESSSNRILKKALRLCNEAYQQGALLSNVDLSQLLGKSDATIAQLLAAHERQTQTIVPRRATLHDHGSGLTHKRIICWKRYAQGKSPDQIARETYHSLWAVDAYLAKYDRVRHCLEKNIEPHDIAHLLNCSLRLVNEYVAIDNDLKRSEGFISTENAEGPP